MFVLFTSAALMPLLAVSMIGTLSKLANVIFLTVSAPFTPVSSLSMPSDNKSTAFCAIDTEPPANDMPLVKRLNVLLKLPPTALSAPESAAKTRPSFSPSLKPSASLYSIELMAIGRTLMSFKLNNLASLLSIAAISAGLMLGILLLFVTPKLATAISDNGEISATTVLMLPPPTTVKLIRLKFWLPKSISLFVASSL